MLKNKDRYIHYLRTIRGSGENTCESYARDLRDFEIWMEISSIDESELGLSDVRGFIGWCSTKGLSARSINRKLSAIRGYSSYQDRLTRESGNSQGYGFLDTVKSVKSLKQKRKLPRFLFEDEVISLLSQESSENEKSFKILRDNALFEFLYSTGTRVSEAAGVGIRDVDMKKGRVKVLGKGQKERFVFLGRAAKDAIGRYLLSREIVISKAGNPKDQNQHLFVNLQGQPLSVRGIQYIVKKRAVDQGLAKGLTPHGLRHSYATHIMNRGADIRVVQELLGHAHLKTTQVYTHLNIEKLKETYSQAHPHGGRRTPGIREK